MAVSDRLGAQQRVNELVEKLVYGLLSTFDKELKGAYLKGLSGVSRELGRSFNIKNLDINKPASGMVQGPLYDLTDELKARTFQLLAEQSLSNTVNTRKIVEELSSVANYTEARLQTIARTETNRFFQMGRRAGYKQAEKEAGELFMYKWAGPNDQRTTVACQRIKSRIQELGGGVPWDLLIKIVEEEQIKDFPEFVIDYDAPTCHYNCRHFALRTTNG